MNCATCGLVLPPGASHANERACVEALKHAVQSATRCRTCGTDVKLVVHPSCVAKTAARMGVDAAVERGTDMLMERLFGGGSDKPPAKAAEPSPGKTFDP